MRRRPPQQFTGPLAKVPLTPAMHRKIVAGFRDGMYMKGVAGIARISVSHLEDLIEENESLRADVDEASALAQQESLKSVRDGENIEGHRWFLTHRFKDWQSPADKLKARELAQPKQAPIQINVAQQAALQARLAEYEPLQLPSHAAEPVRGNVGGANGIDDDDDDRQDDE